MHSTYSVRQANSGGSDNLQRPARALRAAHCSSRHPSTELGLSAAPAPAQRPAAGEVRNG